ncbi:MAG: ATP-binding cassette domain-containing protein, partial [Pseudomonadota bacterium]
MSVGLTVRDVSCFASNGTVLLQDASFQLEQGAILAIAGPNGAGKTTLLNVLCGINSPSRGEVLIGERPLYAMPAAERACQIAVVGQQDMPDG